LAGIDITIEMYSRVRHENLCITIIFWDRLGRNVTTLCSLDQPDKVPLVAGNNRIFVNLPASNFTPGSYSIDIALNPSFIEPAWDVLRGIPIGDVILSPDSESQSLISTNRTWGTMHVDNVHWRSIDVN
jgi:hypothetical protein